MHIYYIYNTDLFINVQMSGLLGVDARWSIYGTFLNWEFLWG